MKRRKDLCSSVSLQTAEILRFAQNDRIQAPFSMVGGKKLTLPVVFPGHLASAEYLNRLIESPTSIVEGWM